jgi:5,10-methenyltetrahydrofolate synthetase
MNREMTDTISMPALDVKRWRKAERERLIGERLAMSAEDRLRRAEAIADRLDEVAARPGRTVSVYWPLRGEPDLRSWMGRLTVRGVVCALPVVTIPNAPLTFRRWTPNTRMERGFWNIPVPAEGADVVPDIVIAPVIGFDAACYRLGYGGGYFDRTLAALHGKPHAIGPHAIGIGYAQAAIATIHPQPHDIPMNAIITEDGIQQCGLHE